MIPLLFQNLNSRMDRACYLIVVTTLCFFSIAEAQTLTAGDAQVSPDSVGPIEVYFEEVDSTHITSSEYDVLLDEFIVVNSASLFDQNAYLLYHSSGEGDSLLTKIEMPFSVIESIDTVNLDGKGKAELIVTAKTCYYGSGGGTCSKGTLVYDLTSTPKLLLKVVHYFSEEGFPRLYGDEMVSGHLEEYGRGVHIEDLQIVISPVDVKRVIELEKRYGPIGLTKSPAGRYIYSNGKIERKKMK